MAVNTTLSGLSQTAASNGPDGSSDAPSTLDDAIRNALAFIAQLRDGVGFNTPAFSAYQSIAQSVSAATAAKILFQTEEFDTNGTFSSSRFQPTTPGYYQINASVCFVSPAPIVLASVYKNGSEYKRGTQFGTNTAVGYGSAVAALVYLNGSTDYVEIYANQSSPGALATLNTQASTYFQGFLARSA